MQNWVFIEQSIEYVGACIARPRAIDNRPYGLTVFQTDKPEFGKGSGYMIPIEKRIETVVDGILSDYQAGRVIDRLETVKKPDTERIGQILHKLRRILFPGYFREKTYKFYNPRHNLSVLIEDVMVQLSQQIALVYQNEGLPEEQALEKAQENCLEFLGAVPQVRAMLQLDLEAFYEGDPAASSNEEILYAYPGFYAITVYRLANRLYQLGVPMIPRIMTEQAHAQTGIDIHPGATIGKYFFIDHGTGIVVGQTTHIGHHVKLYQGVTLGALSTRGGQSLRGRQRHPTIEDNVTIYAGASVLGGDTVIGHGSVIGSNAFITRSVAPNTTVSIQSQQTFKTRENEGL